MEDHERSRIAAKLLSGITFFTFEKKRYKIINPTPEQLLLSEEIALEHSIRASFKQLLSEEEAKEHLNEKGIWTHQDENNMKESDKALEDLKELLYKKRGEDRTVAAIRRKIKGTRQAIHEAMLRKYSMNPMTWEYHHRAVRNEFLAAVCTFDEDNNRMYHEKDFGSADSTLMEVAYEAREMDGITQEQMREVSRNEPWQSYWMVSKQNLFGNPMLNMFGPSQNEAVIIPSSHLNAYQRAMVGICKMYDNAAQHPDCPEQSVMDDDDMFDGWMIFENRKREKEQNKKRIDELADKKGDEIFVMARSGEDAHDIFSVNEETDKHRLKSRFQQAHHAGEKGMKESELVDVKQALHKQMVEQVKGQR